jgi:hypothetical protein
MAGNPVLMLIFREIRGASNLPWPLMIQNGSLDGNSVAFSRFDGVVLVEIAVG